MKGKKLSKKKSGRSKSAAVVESDGEVQSGVRDEGSSRSQKELALSDLLPPADDADDRDGTPEEGALPVNFGLSDSEEEDEDEGRLRHDNLLEAVKSVTGKRSHHPTRSEPASKASMFNLSRKEGDHVELDDLLSPLKKMKSFRSLQKRLKLVQEGSSKLEAPLPKVHADRIQRSAAYSAVSEQVSQWVPTIKRNREADHLYLTHQEERPPLPSISNLVESHEPKTPLEKEIAALLMKSDSATVSKKDGLSKAEKRALERMALEEAKERRRELQKMRTLAFYQEQKFKREKKIKSKKFHKIKRKRKEKELRKELESAGGAVEQAEPLLYQRAMERMTLKHSSHSKWAKRALRSGTKSTDMKKLLADTHQLGHQLKEKLAGQSLNEDKAEEEEDQMSEGSDSDGEDLDVTVRDPQGNPWLSASALHSQQSHNKTASSVAEDEIIAAEEDGLAEVSGHVKTPPRLSTAPTGDVNTDATLLERVTTDQPDKPKKAAGRRGKRPNIDVGNILMLATDPEQGSVEQVEKAKKQLMTIKTAFADDDVVQDFLKEKGTIEKDECEKDVELTLPGWGCWAGEGVKTSTKPKVIKKARPQPPRRDSHLKHVIISEARDRKAARHQVSSVPYPYQSRDQLEKAICHPTGKHWNSEAVFQELIKPRVILPVGTVITPIERTAEQNHH